MEFLRIDIANISDSMSGRRKRRRLCRWVCLRGCIVFGRETDGAAVAGANDHPLHIRPINGHIGVTQTGQRIVVRLHRGSVREPKLLGARHVLGYEGSSSQLPEDTFSIFSRDTPAETMVAPDSSVSSPSSVSKGVSSTDFMVTAILAQEAIAFLDSLLYCR